MKFFIFIICSLCFVSFFSIATAQEDNQNTECDSFYAQVQITQRDNDGNLITFFERSDHNYIDFCLVDQLFVGISDENDPIFELEDGKMIQTMTRESYLHTDLSGLLSTVQYFIKDSLNRQFVVVQFTHDGMRLADDETIHVLWTFARFV
jgi:hypothetical protein